MTEPSALEVIEAALSAAEQKRWGDVPDRVAVGEWAAEIHDRLVAAGLLLPEGTETVEQWGDRIVRDGTDVLVAGAGPHRNLAQDRVEHHARMRAENPGWRGSAELVHRHQHTTPWTTAPTEEKP